LKLGNPDMVIHTDASSSEGWGASLVGGAQQEECIDQGREGKIPHKRAGAVGSREKSETQAGP